MGGAGFEVSEINQFNRGRIPFEDGRSEPRSPRVRDVVPKTATSLALEF